MISQTNNFTYMKKIALLLLTVLAIGGANAQLTPYVTTAQNYVTANITSNGANQITGAKLNTALNNILQTIRYMDSAQQYGYSTRKALVDSAFSLRAQIIAASDTTGKGLASRYWVMNSYIPMPLWSNIQSKPSSFPPSAHTHTLADLAQSGATTGQSAVWNGTAWAPFTVTGGGGGGATSYGDLLDATTVDLTNVNIPLKNALQSFVSTFEPGAGTAWNIGSQPRREQTITANTDFTLTGGVNGQAVGLFIITNTDSFTVTFDGEPYDIRNAGNKGGKTAITALKLLGGSYYVSSDYTASAGSVTPGGGGTPSNYTTISGSVVESPTGTYTMPNGAYMLAAGAMAADGYVTAKIPTGGSASELAILGLDDNNTANNYVSNWKWVAFTYLGNYYILDLTVSGSPVDKGVAYSVGDDWKMERVGSTIYLKVNGATIHTFTTTSSSTLYHKAAGANAGGGAILKNPLLNGFL